MTDLRYAEETTSDAVEEWFRDPANRRLLPVERGALISALRPFMDLELLETSLDEHELDLRPSDQPLAMEQFPRIESALQLVEQLLNSSAADSRMDAAVLFGVIIGGGRVDALKDICDQSEAGRFLWAVFVESVHRYLELSPAVSRMQAQHPAGRTGLAQRTQTVIVHGTLASRGDWWREKPGQKNFWEYIHAKTGDCVRQGSEFSWSGGLFDSDREQGARLFLNWWYGQGKPTLRVIAHSHGANVVWCAAALDPALVVESMISLGTPICVGYPLRLKQIRKIDNVYSEYDRTQWLGATATGSRGEGRTLPDSSQVTNYHVPNWNPSVRVQTVDHSDLHEPSVWRDNHLDALL